MYIDLVGNTERIGDGRTDGRKFKIPSVDRPLLGPAKSIEIFYFIQCFSYCLLYVYTETLDIPFLYSFLVSPIFISNFMPNMFLYLLNTQQNSTVTAQFNTLQHK